MNVAAHQEKEKNEKTGKKKPGERKRQSTILKKLRAALLRLFKGLHGEKMVCVKAVPGGTGTLEKANSHFDPTQMGLGTALPRRGGC